MFEVKMPQWGMNMVEGVVVQWLKREGERVEKGEPLAEIESAKAVETLQAPVAGVLTQIVARLDEAVPVHGVIAIIAE
jgi:pyruvate dehydrogenase E2 component (dihydrolipoamide acetyltransferase)